MKGIKFKKIQIQKISKWILKIKLRLISNLFVPVGCADRHCVSDCLFSIHSLKVSTTWILNNLSKNAETRDLEHKTIISIAGVCVATCVRSKVKILIRGWKLLQQKLVLKYSKRTVSLRHVTIEAICPFVDQKIKFLNTPFNQNWRIKPAIFRSSSRFTLASTSVLPTVTYSHVDSFFSFYEKL